MALRITVLLIGIAMLGAARAESQHLWWDAKGLENATCLYGEITVLATHHPIYYCGANWHPGEPAGGYCGIQHNKSTERRTIFSVWDTSPKLNPRVTAADPQTKFNRFGGEGEGAHTHMLWNWQVGETFRYSVHKQSGREPNTTDAQYYIYDPTTNAWRHSASITSPNGTAESLKSVATLGGGGVVSFLENFGGTDRDVPKLALYRLWLGDTPDSMKCLTRSGGDGIWGQLGDAYFLAEGNREQMNGVFATWQQKYGEPVFGKPGEPLPPISNRRLPADLIQQLNQLPASKAVDQE